MLYSAVPIPGVGPGVGYECIFTSRASILRRERGISSAFLLNAVREDLDIFAIPSAVKLPVTPTVYLESYEI